MPDPVLLTDPSFVFAQGYFYAATALNTSLVESEFSNQLSQTWLNPTAPSAPGNLRESEQGVEMRLRWERNDPEERVNVYRVYKSSSEEEYGALLALTGGGKGEFGQYYDSNYARFGPKFYRVTAVNDAGVESDAAGPVKYVGRSDRRVQ
jgi:fibronectin type 3 domain-containing protein